MMNLPIGDLFMAGLIPGILMVVAMQLVCYYVCRKNGWGVIQKFEAKRAMKLGAKAWLGFLAIGIVLWGIYTGAFSPTEAAGITTGFCLLAGVLVTREIKLKSLPTIMMRSGQITGMLAPLIAVSVVMQQVLSLLQ